MKTVDWLTYSLTVLCIHDSDSWCFYSWVDSITFRPGFYVERGRPCGGGRGECDWSEILWMRPFWWHLIRHHWPRLCPPLHPQRWTSGRIANVVWLYSHCQLSICAVRVKREDTGQSIIRWHNNNDHDNYWSLTVLVGSLPYWNETPANTHRWSLNNLN